MPTPSEHKALAFAAVVVLLAGAVRVVRAGGTATPEPSPAEQQGLARQAFAADSASTAQRAAKVGRASGKGAKSGKVTSRRRDTGVKVVGGIAGVPFSDVRPGGSKAGDSVFERPFNRFGYPPPSPRIDVGSAPPSPVAGSAGWRPASPRGSKPAPAGPIDLDSAGEEEIMRLPKVGPALAERIIRNRDSLGAFRSMEGLRRVKGIGPATAALLAPLVTFSGQARH